MSNCTECNDSILNPQIGQLPFCVDCANESQTCIQKFPAECVMYHMDTDAPSKLVNLGIPNNKSVSYILEAIDKLIASGFNIPLIATNTKTIAFTTSAPAGHNIKADVKISQNVGNIIQQNDDGLFAGTTELGKLKVNSTDTLAYLEEQVVGETDGIISISTPVVDGLLTLLPDINVENLLTDIRINHLNSFNQLLSVSNSSSSATNISAKLAPFIAYPYHGSLTNFDATGKGLVANGYDKIYVCNGENGTPDYRGRSPIGANVGVPATTPLDSSVISSGTDNITIALNQKIGNYKHVLSATEEAPHDHTINDSGHFHYTVANAGDSGYLNGNPNNSIAWTSDHHNGNQDYDLVSNSATPTLGKTDTKATGITINQNSGGNAHNNTHPVIGTIFIMYIP